MTADERLELIAAYCLAKLFNTNSGEVRDVVCDIFDVAKLQDPTVVAAVQNVTTH